METKQERKFDSAPNWPLAEHVMTYESISDAAAGSRLDQIRGYVVAYRHAEDDAARIKLEAGAGGFHMDAWMTPDRARRLAAALIQAADICEAFDAQQAEVAS